MSPSTSPTISVDALRCEHRTNPFGIDAARPRLSWKLQAPAGARGIVQTSYQLQAADSISALAAGNLLWESGSVASETSILVPYGGPALRSGQHVVWRVRVGARMGDAAPQTSAWSEPAWWEMGLLQASDWRAQWISPEFDRGALEDVPLDAGNFPLASPPCPMLRKGFQVTKPIAQARLYASALGLYEMSLNGAKVGDQELTPGWTAYDHRLQYQVYDVTGQLRQGENALGAMLANGWWRGPLPHARRYGDRLALLAQVHLLYEDGSEGWVVSDTSWQATTGPLRSASLYQGETYDARLEKPGWDAPGYAVGDWQPCEALDAPAARLVAPAGPAVRRIEEIKPIAILTTPEGDTVVDMGQNMVGWLRLNVQGPAGATVKLLHFEVLDKEGNVYTENLRHALQTNSYTCKGEGVEVYEPRFTFQGFRYVAVDGYPGELTLDSLTGVVVHSQMAVTGGFETSYPLLNQLQHNILWGQKGNFVDVPTDCPQRDERLGWLGDAQVFIRTAAFNMDVAAFFTRWLADLAADQRADGSVPEVVPDILKRHLDSTISTAAWADAIVICPWTIYLCYGDRQILETMYPHMKAYVGHLWEIAGEEHIWQGGFYGDWLSFQSNASDGQSASTSKDLIGTAFMAYSTRLTGQIAALLGYEEDAQRLAERAALVTEVWRQEYVTPKGRVASETQTGYALALMFDLLPQEQRPVAAKRLVADIQRRGNHLTTGFVGTPYLCHVLSQTGYTPVAYDLVHQRDYPSWLYPVTQGATTIWERWDGQKPDGTFQTPAMNSFNHYAYGAIGDWLYQRMAGLRIDEQAPGYKHAIIAPEPGAGTAWDNLGSPDLAAEATLETVYGKLASAWTLAMGGSMTLNVTVPPNTTASVRLPGALAVKVQEGGQPLAQAVGVSAVQQLDDAVVLNVASGSYQFVYQMGAVPDRPGMGAVLAGHKG